jgi:hypothetical protein
MSRSTTSRSPAELRWWVEADADPPPERSGRIGALFDIARAERRGEALTVVALDMDGPAAAAGLDAETVSWR